MTLKEFKGGLEFNKDKVKITSWGDIINNKPVEEQIKSLRGKVHFIANYEYAMVYEVVPVNANGCFRVELIKGSK